MNSLRNSVRLIGNLGAAPEVKNLDNGNKVAKLNLATNETYTNQKGSRFHPISLTLKFISFAALVASGTLLPYGLNAWLRLWQQLLTSSFSLYGLGLAFAGVVGFGIAKEAVTVGVHFQHSAAGDEFDRLAVFRGHFAFAKRFGIVIAVAWRPNRPVGTATIIIGIARTRRTLYPAAQPAPFLLCHIAHLREFSLLGAVNTHRQPAIALRKQRDQKLAGMVCRVGRNNQHLKG